MIIELIMEIWTSHIALILQILQILTRSDYRFVPLSTVGHWDQQLYPCGRPIFWPTKWFTSWSPSTVPSRCDVYYTVDGVTKFFIEVVLISRYRDEVLYSTTKSTLRANDGAVRYRHFSTNWWLSSATSLSNRRLVVIVRVITAHLKSVRVKE